MLLLLPVGLLLIASLTIFILDKLQPRFGTSWLVAAVASSIAWVVVLFLRLRLPTSLPILSWGFPGDYLIGRLSLLLDYDSWPYILALTTITLAVILSDAARTRYDSNPQAWSAGLVITGFGLLAIQSGTSLTLMLIWIISDLLELVYLLRLKSSAQHNLRIIISYGVRTAAILSLMLGTSIGRQVSGDFDLTGIPQQAAFLFMLAAGLRLGVFPLNLPFLKEPELRRGVGNIIRLAPVAASLTLLARLPANLISPALEPWLPLFNGLLALAALYAAVRWISATDEIEGRPFWIVAWAAPATASVLNGAPQASLAWGIALLLPGSLLFLYYPRIQRMNFLQYFGLLGLMGLPFTPLASGWFGLVANGVNFWSFLFVIAHALMIFGFLIRIFEPGGQPGILESWARLVYPLGLIVIIQALVALGLVGWPGSFTPGIWWLALISTLLVIGAVILVQRFGINPPYLHFPSNSKFVKVMERVLPLLEKVFRLEWVYRLGWQIHASLSKVFRTISAILEGEGGLLWTLLLLVLLILVITGGNGG